MKGAKVWSDKDPHTRRTMLSAVVFNPFIGYKLVCFILNQIDRTYVFVSHVKAQSGTFRSKNTWSLKGATESFAS